MAGCVSCGRPTEEGKIFCQECFAAITPGEAGKTGEEESRAPGGQAPSPGERQPPDKAAGTPEKTIDAVKASVLTPPSEKKVVKAAPVLPEKKGREKKEKPPREGPTPREKAKRAASGAGRGAKRLGAALKGAVLWTGRWLKGLALKENTPFEREDWVAWWIGTAASLLLVITACFMDFLRFGWMPVWEDAFEAVYSILKASDLGVFGYTLVVLSVLIFLMNMWLLISSRWKIRAVVNPAFLVTVLCVLALITMPIALASNQAIVRSSAGSILENTEELGYAKKTLLYGSYVAMACLVLTFAAAASNLAEEKTVPEWMRSLFTLGKTKAQAMARKAAPGRHDRKKGGSSA